MPSISSDDEEPASLLQCTDADLDILHEIVALATTIPGSQSFRIIWKAYDTVLAAHKIDPALDSVYFRFIMQMQSAPGEGLREKFGWMLEKIGVDLENSRYTDFTEPVSEAIMGEYNRMRYEAAKGRRDRGKSSGSENEEDGDDDDEEEEYTGDDESTGPQQRVPQVEVRPTRKTLGGSPEGAVNAANAAAQRQRLNTQERRHASDSTEELTDDSVHEELAHAASRFYTGVMMRKVFRHWKEKTVDIVEQRWFAVLERRAGRRYDLSIMAKTWDVWVRNTAAIVQRTHEVKQRILARKYFNIWKSRVQGNHQKVIHFQLSVVLQRWIKAYNRRQQLEDQAVILYQKNLAAYFYWKWYFKHLNIAVPQRYLERLASVALSQWREKMDHAMELNAKAKEFFRHRTLQKFLSRWVQKTEDSLDDQDRALDYYDMRRQQTALDNWRRQVTIARFTKCVRDLVDDRIMHEKFTIWRQRTRNEIAAAELYKVNLIRKTFLTWRLTLRHDIMAEYHDSQIRRNTLQHWVRQERLQLVSRTHNRKLVRGALALFIEKIQEKQTRLQVAAQQVRRMRRKNLAGRIFQWWREQLQYKASVLQERALKFRAVMAFKTMRNVLVNWQQRLSDVKAQEELADEARFFYTAKHALVKWKAATNESKKNRLRKTYQDISRERKRAIARLFFDHWRKRTREIWYMEHRAEDRFRTVVLPDLGRGAISLWVDKMTQIQRNKNEANEVNNQRLMREGLEVWIAKFNHLRELDTRLEVYLREKNLELVGQYFEKWNNRYSRFATRIEVSVKESERRQKRQYQFLLRMWKAKASLRQQSRRSSFEGEYGEVTVIPMRDGAVTPPRPFKTPGWKTTGRRKSGMMLNNRSLSLMPNASIGSPGSPLKRYNIFAKSMFGKVNIHHESEDDGTLVGSGPTHRSQSSIGAL